MRGRSRHFSTGVAVCVGLVAGAGFGGLYLGVSARTSFAPAASSTVVAEIAPADVVSLRFPADWTDAAGEPAQQTLAFASADGSLTLFSPRPIYPIVAATETAPTAIEASADAKPVDVKPADAKPAEAKPAAQPKIALASASSKPVNVAPKPVVHRTNAVLNDSQIASIKRRLALTPDQERYWPAVEAELRKMEYRKDKAQGTRTAQIDMSKINVEGLKSAGFPLVMSFSDDQRRELKSLAHLLGLESVMSGI
jgi:hypothetical protein